MPGLDFSLRVGAALPTVKFALDSNDQVTTDNPVAAQGGINLINLGNVLIHVDPTTYAGTYNVGGYTGLSGPAIVTLVPGITTHSVSAGGQSGLLLIRLTHHATRCSVSWWRFAGRVKTAIPENTLGISVPVRN